MSDASWQNIRSEIKKVLTEKPVHTGTTKQTTVDKLNTLIRQFITTLRVERALKEMQKDIDNYGETMQQLVQSALAIRDEHLAITRFRITWDDVKRFKISYVTVIRKLLTVLNSNSRQVSKHTSLNHGAVSEHLKSRRNLRPASIKEFTGFLCTTITAAELPAAPIALAHPIKKI